MMTVGPGSRGKDFWRASGYHLVRTDAEGRLCPTDDFLRAYLLRPELVPVEESCRAEVALHEALMAEPRLAVPDERLAALADPDARDNYRAVLHFRDRLLAAPSLEAAYLDLVRRGGSGLPPLFLDQLVHVILRHLLDGCDDPIRLRAAELLFREQKVSVRDGAVLLADDETVEMRSRSRGLATPGGLLIGAAAPAREVELDILDEAGAASYWERSDRFDTVLDLSFTRPGLDALCRVLERWIEHFTLAAVSIQPVQAVRDERWRWHVGLDAEASTLLNDLYEGKEVTEVVLARLLALFRLEFRDPEDVLPELRGRPVYLGLAMSAEQRARLKPQNLLINLPLARAA